MFGLLLCAFLIQQNSKVVGIPPIEVLNPQPAIQVLNVSLSRNYMPPQKDVVYTIASVDIIGGKATRIKIHRVNPNFNANETYELPLTFTYDLEKCSRYHSSGFGKNLQVGEEFEIDVMVNGKWAPAGKTKIKRLD